MTPAVKAAQKAGITYQLHSYKHNPANTNYGTEAAQALNLDAERVFKTLIADLSDELVVAIVPVNRQLNLKALAKAMGAKKAKMAEVSKGEKSSGYIAGGISPIGQKKRLRTCIDQSAFNMQTLYVSAGRRGLEIELQASDLQIITGAIGAAISG